MVSLSLSVALIAVACADEPESITETTAATLVSTTTTTPPGATTTQALETPEDTTTTTIAEPEGDCTLPEGQPFIPTDSVELTDLGEIGGVSVKAARYPHPDYDAELWSQWGQGIVLEDGRFFSAIGDHKGADGNSYIYEFDPATETLTMVGDILSYVDQEPGTWGYGKVHSQMVQGPCGEIYFSTYWGSFRDIEFEGNYTGDILFRLDPMARTLDPLGVPVEFHGQASLAADPTTGHIFGEAVDPLPMSDEIEVGPFFAYDVVSEEVTYVGPDEPHVGYRSILMDAEGVAYYSIGDGRLQTYDPETGDTGEAASQLPGDFLRAVTEPAADGSVYGVTDEEDVFFVMNPDGSIEDLGAALEYTASVALSPDGSRFYHMPGAHGDAPEWGSPLISVDTATGEQTVVVELNEAIQEEFGHTVGGTYSVTLSPDGGTVYLGVNGGPVGSEDEAFGEVFLIVVELP